LSIEELKKKIRDVPDFPIEGIMFRDITTLISDGEAFGFVIDTLHDRYREMNIDRIVGIESRGFIFGGALAHRLGCGFAIARKPGKLPADTIEETYDLEYGRATLQIHSDAIARGDRVVIIDDLLATGGTLDAAARLTDRLGGHIAELAVIIELEFLKGRAKFGDRQLFSMVRYER